MNCRGYEQRPDERTVRLRNGHAELIRRGEPGAGGLATLRTTLLAP